MKNAPLTLIQKVEEPAFADRLQVMIQQRTIEKLVDRIAEREVDRLLSERPELPQYELGYQPVLTSASVLAAIPLSGIWKSDLIANLADVYGVTSTEAGIAVRDAKRENLIQYFPGKMNRTWVNRITDKGEWEIQWGALFEKEEVKGKVLVDKVQTLTGKAKSTAYQIISRAVSEGKLIEFLDGREKSYQIAPGPVSETN